MSRRKKIARPRPRGPYWDRVKWFCSCVFGCDIGRGEWARFSYSPYWGRNLVTCRSCMWKYYKQRPPRKTEPDPALQIRDPKSLAARNDE